MRLSYAPQANLQSRATSSADWSKRFCLKIKLAFLGELAGKLEISRDCVEDLLSWNRRESDKFSTVEIN